MLYPWVATMVMSSAMAMDSVMVAATDLGTDLAMAVEQCQTQYMECR